jgi:hypothetical protein
VGIYRLISNGSYNMAFPVHDSSATRLQELDKELGFQVSRFLSLSYIHAQLSPRCSHALPLAVAS